jgi:hypothetical protein
MTIAEAVEVWFPTLDNSVEIIKLPTFDSWTKGEQDAAGVRIDTVTFTDGSELEVTVQPKLNTPASVKAEILAKLATTKITNKGVVVTGEERAAIVDAAATEVAEAMVAADDNTPSDELLSE